MAATSFLHFLATEFSESDPGGRRIAGEATDPAHTTSASEDITLIARLRSGERTAFDAVVNQYAARLARFAALFTHDPDDAEDVVADVFGALWAKRARLEIHGGMATYLFGAVRNAARQRHRNVTRRAIAGTRFLAEQGASPAMGASPDAPDSAITSDKSAELELEGAVIAAIGRLPERARMAVTLRWYEQMDYEAVARILGISVVAARQTVHRAIQTLRRELPGK